jgi:hypothetical protein
MHVLVWQVALCRSHLWGNWLRAGTPKHPWCLGTGRRFLPGEAVLHIMLLPSSRVLCQQLLLGCMAQR